MFFKRMIGEIAEVLASKVVLKMCCKLSFKYLVGEDIVGALERS